MLVFGLAVLLPCAFVCTGAAAASGQPQYLKVTLGSKLLTAFWQHDVGFEAHVLLPDSYYKEPTRRYPILYWIQGFGGEGNVDLRTELAWQRPMRVLHREFILVYLNGMFNGGHQEFADSQNNGPWGTALTQEFIPKTEAYFRTYGDSAHRFVGGHSSGGWCALWLQITYPSVFGGEWSISPDPVDFRDFGGPDLTRFPPQNFFRDDRGNAYLFDSQKMSAFVTGPGWEQKQFESFDAVFSPRGTDGRPEALFNRKSGVIDPTVQRYWDDHWDISELLARSWSTLGPQLRHKLHVIVGTSDQFGLEKPVRLLQERLTTLGSDAEFDYAPGADHFTVYDWHGGLRTYIIGEISSMLPPGTE